MFYVYRNTTEKSEAVAQFSNKDAALQFMEEKTLREIRPDVTGYAVRDYLLNIYAEMEI